MPTRSPRRKRELARDEPRLTKRCISQIRATLQPHGLLQSYAHAAQLWCYTAVEKAMWTHEESIETSATPVRVWEFFADVALWKNWNAGIETIEIHGPFQAGTTFTMRPPSQDAIVSTLVEVKLNESFTDETVVDGTRVLVSHKLMPLSSGNTRIIYSTEITGPDAEELGPMITSDFGDVLATLKRLAEQQ